jgi:hypothetical protein
MGEAETGVADVGWVALASAAWAAAWAATCAAVGGGMLSAVWSAAGEAGVSLSGA